MTSPSPPLPPCVGMPNIKYITTKQIELQSVTSEQQWHKQETHCRLKSVPLVSEGAGLVKAILVLTSASNGTSCCLEICWISTAGCSSAPTKL